MIAVYEGFILNRDQLWASGSLPGLGRLKPLSQLPAPALGPDSWEGNSETGLSLPSFIGWEAPSCLWLLSAEYLSFPSLPVVTGNLSSDAMAKMSVPSCR